MTEEGIPMHDPGDIEQDPAGRARTYIHLMVVGRRFLDQRHSNQRPGRGVRWAILAPKARRRATSSAIERNMRKAGSWAKKSLCPRRRHGGLMGSGLLSI